MKNRKGFTLTELLVVIAMIAVIGTVIIVNTVSINKRAKDTEYDRMIENIVNSAKTYVSLYPEEFGDLYSTKAFSFISLTIALRVVDLPEPGLPVTNISPCVLNAKSLIIGGKLRLS